MALSVIHFRMHHGNSEDQITFSGNGIKLLDLKREIIEKKQISGSLDFDLKIVDESGKVYTEDDEVVPKNASLVARKTPVINSSSSLIARLKNRGYMKTSGSQQIIQKSGEIVMPMKIDAEESEKVPVTAPITIVSANTEEEDDVVKLLEEETVLKRTVPVNALPVMGGSTVTGTNRPGLSTGGVGVVANKTDTNNALMYSSSYKCPRCGKIGHKEKFCPTIGDPAFDPYIGLANVPKAGRKKVSSLEGIDISQNTVIEHKDGTYELFESSSAGRDMLKRDADTHLNSNIDLAIVPSNLKCAFSNTILKDAVSLPCCKKIVSDSIIRLELIRTSLQCPLCQTSGISPDSLIVCKDVREAVENYVQNYGKAPIVASSSSASSVSGVSEKPYVPAPPSSLPPVAAITAAKPPPPPTTERPVISAIAVGNTVIPSDFNNLSLNSNPVLPAYTSGPHPMHHLGMMGMGQPMMFPSTGGMISNPLDEIPPLEALPLPLSLEEFLYEQQLQIEIMKERGFYRGGYPGRGRGYQGRGYYGRGGDRGGYQGRSEYGRGRGRGRWNYNRDDSNYDRNDRYSYESRDKDEIHGKSERSEIFEEENRRVRRYEDDNRPEKRHDDDRRSDKRYEDDRRSDKRYEDDRRSDKRYEDDRRSDKRYDDDRRSDKRYEDDRRNNRRKDDDNHYAKHSRNKSPDRKSTTEKYNHDDNDRNRNYRERSNSKEKIKSRGNDKNQHVEEKHQKRRERSLSKERTKSRSDRDHRRSSRDEIENTDEQVIDYDNKSLSKRKREDNSTTTDFDEKPKEKLNRSHKEDTYDQSRQKDKEKSNKDHHRDREKDNYQKDREKDRNHKDREREHHDKPREKDRYENDREIDNYQKDRSHRDRERENNEKPREKERYENDREKDRSNKERERINKDRQIDKDRSNKDRDDKSIDNIKADSSRDTKEKYRSNKSNNDVEEIGHDESIIHQEIKQKMAVIPPLKSSRNINNSSTILSSQNPQSQSNNNKSKRIIIINETSDNKRRK